MQKSFRYQDMICTASLYFQQSIKGGRKSVTLWNKPGRTPITNVPSLFHSMYMNCHLDYSLSSTDLVQGLV